MPYVIAAVVFVGLLCAADLVLTLGVVRRLREQGDELRALRESPGGGLPPGTGVGPFEALAVDGQPVSTKDLTGESLVGFFSTSCPACHTQLPLFVERAKGSGRVLAVVTGSGPEAGDMVATLSDVARVVHEAEGGPVTAAFAVRGWPYLFRLDGATVLAGGHSVDALRVPAAV